MIAREKNTHPRFLLSRVLDESQRENRWCVRRARLQSDSIRVKKLSHTNLVATRHLSKKRKKRSLRVDVRRSSLLLHIKIKAKKIPGSHHSERKLKNGP